MRRTRSARIVATLGPVSSDDATIRALFEAGADVFRLNLSLGLRENHAKRVKIIRALEAEFDRPIGVLIDLQGSKPRLGLFAGGGALLREGTAFRLDTKPTEGDTTRACLPHPEVFAVLKAGTQVLLDDGRVRLEVTTRGHDFAETKVLQGGPISDKKGVNVPGVLLPVAPLTSKDRDDLEFGLGLGADWVALSFVQRAQDIVDLRAVVADRAWVMAKLEQPAAVAELDAIVAASDAVMVARGDLGVELPPEDVPELQRRIVRVCRAAGKPVVVATQMLESMTQSTTPTRAEVSDVATAIYDGVDAVMLAAETASGMHPAAAVGMMNRIIVKVEASPSYREGIDASQLAASVGSASTADAVSGSLRQIAAAIKPAALITYTASGFTSLRTARQRPAAPILSLTPSLSTARRLALVWGAHAVAIDEVHDVADMIKWATRIAVIEGFAGRGHDVVIAAGLPFGEPGTTNLLHVAKIG